MGTLTLKTEKSYENIVTTDNARLGNVIAKASDGSVFTSGVFDTEFEGLTPIAASSYVIKSDAAYTAAWKVAIQGSATVTALVSDAEGGVFVGGNLADEVVFNGIDGASKTVTGYAEQGAYTTTQCAAFVAHYDKDGRLLAVQTIVPKHNADLDNTGMYFPSDGDIYCNLSSLVYTNGTLYTALNFTNTITTTDGSASVASGSYDVEGGGFYYSATKAAAVAQLDADLNVTSFPISLKSKDFAELFTGYDVMSTALTADNAHLYLALVSTGSNYLTAFGGEPKEIAFTASTEGNSPLGFCVVDIDLNARSTVTAQWNGDTENAGVTRITNVATYGDDLVLTGYFQGKLPFNTATTANSYSDVFAASLSKSDLSVNWSTASNYNEDAVGKNKVEEKMAAATIVGGTLFIGAYADSISGHKLTTPLYYTVDLTDGALGTLSNERYVSGLCAYDESTLLTAMQPADLSGVTFGTYTYVSAGIDGVTTNKADDGKLYNLNGQRVYEPMKGIYLKNGKKYIAR